MRKAFKYRIYLTNGQRRILEQQLEECRWVYNQMLAHDAMRMTKALRTADCTKRQALAADLESGTPSAETGAFARSCRTYT